jgi:hypothetical protein
VLWRKNFLPGERSASSADHTTLAVQCGLMSVSRERGSQDHSFVGY